MKYFVVLNAAYLMVYYFVLIKRPSSSYVLSVVVAGVSGCLSTLFIILLLIFGKKSTETALPIYALLSHGLSYEEWRSVKVVKEKMDKVQKITKEENNISKDTYLIYLLILAFSGLVEQRPETPQERSDATLGNMPLEGDSLKCAAYAIGSPDENQEPIPVEHIVDRAEAEKFTAYKHLHVEMMTKKFYQGKTLSRLLYDGVHLVFLRKKLGPKRPAKTKAFAKAFGIATNQ